MTVDQSCLLVVYSHRASAGPRRLSSHVVTTVCIARPYAFSRHVIVLICAAIKNYAGVKRELPAHGHSSGGGSMHTTVWDSKNKRHVQSELQRYKVATENVMAISQYTSIGGPDGTKVGTDFAVQGAAIACARAQKVAIAPPQAYIFVS